MSLAKPFLKTKYKLQHLELNKAFDIPFCIIYPLLLCAGNEIQSPGEKLEPGHVRDSNKTTLLTLLKQQVRAHSIIDEDLNCEE